jgi:hypothetical protein
MAGNLIEPAFQCRRVTQATLLTVRAKERLLCEVFGFGSIADEIMDVPRHSCAMLFHFLCNVRQV